MFLTITQSKLPTWIRLIRPHQWVKNLFIFIPSFFAGIFTDLNIFVHLSIGFVAFCCAASAIYIFNDISDLENDLLHPAKKHRPIASGKISVTTAYLMMALLILASFGISLLLPAQFLWVISFYIIFNVFYSLGLKHVAILDIMIVASGFVFRTIGGGIIADVTVSKWLILMIFLLALFLALAKRLDDLLMETKTGIISTKNVGKYNIPYINSGITMLAGIMIVCYIMYSMSDDVMGGAHSDNIYLTSIFVIAGILRYLQILLVERKGWSPTRVLYKDLFIIITIILWALSFVYILYF
ncbi:decaprenyl-phosphate phosphoribosyltransferase [Marivirga sp. S37H4]|uniref:Decaprenyl-phosphate phosphoribosyltransferase n=1 Tax=Marivirga aurantiaca TaxID=2802615 RepID=A0A935CD28_9BACT|nr:decaprenyl-phosphate phosphoribosyltransferase [Marivirga aurantiaca]MBK6266518.1 decaprenyl-phosphate phosphoribosyltransferase [Marivirga aurantiaca]